MVKYKVSRPSNRWRYFTSSREACDYAQAIFAKTGNIVAVEQYIARKA